MPCSKVGDDGGIIDIVGWNTDLFLICANCQKELFQRWHGLLIITGLSQRGLLVSEESSVQRGSHLAGLAPRSWLKPGAELCESRATLNGVAADTTAEIARPPSRSSSEKSLFVKRAQEKRRTGSRKST